LLGTFIEKVKRNMINMKNLFRISGVILFVLSIFLIYSCKKDETASKKIPVITWSNPADIPYGTVLSATQLNATADVAGIFVYTPASGTKLEVGTGQNLKVDFTPTDATNYNSISKSVKINVTAVSTVTDIDGNIYHVVTIGTQTWMAENLKITKYNDGTPIPNVTDNTAWAALTTGAFSDYNNTPANSTIYGSLYNWYAVDNNAATKVASNGGKNVCPTSWHVPTDTEWTTLTTYLGGEYVAGGKLKETGTTHWTSPNTGATNETGFTALPGGIRNGNGACNDIGGYGYWWSSTEYSATSAWYRSMVYDYADVSRNNYNEHLGFSVRCVRDL